jgi:hypothetical protein
MGYLGGGMNDELSYNVWDGNGSSNKFDHTLYFSSVKKLTNMRIVGNYIRGQYGTTCQGAPIVAHMAVDGLLVKDNFIDIDATAATEGCWGIAFNNITGAEEPIYHRNAVFSGNTVRNGGSAAITVSSCPDCVIENNLVINEAPLEATGISVASRAARKNNTDDVNTRNVIRNNTIWFGPNANVGGTGIEVGTEGAGHIVSNNTVTYTASTTAKNVFNCFSYPLALAAYSFINNNHCASAARHSWVAEHGNLAAWKTYAASAGFDTLSINGNPLFVAAASNFTPASGSPLIGAGNTLNKPVSDMSGKTRPNVPSIGAYEHY